MPVKQSLDLFKHVCIALTTESAKNYSKQISLFCFLNLSGPDHSHLFSLIHFMSQLLLEWIILEEAQVRVANHARLDVKPAVANKDHRPSRLLFAFIRVGYLANLFGESIYDWTCAAEYFS